MHTYKLLMLFVPCSSQDVDITIASGGEGYFVPPTNGISQQQVLVTSYGGGWRDITLCCILHKNRYGSTILSYQWTMCWLDHLSQR